MLRQEACAEKSNELTAIPVLLEAPLLKGVIVTIDDKNERLRQKKARQEVAGSPPSPEEPS